MSELISGATKCYLAQFTIKGFDARPFINSLQIYESICKPYLTAIATVLDDFDILNQLQIVGGEDVSFTVMADGGNSYSQNMKVFAIKGERLNYQLRAAYYKLEMITVEYINDKRNLVQQSFKNITGTDIISKVHTQYLGSGINIPIPSSGLLGSGNAIIASNSKPIKFIDDIRRQLTFGQFVTGSTLYYHDNQQVNLAPLEYLISSLSSQQTFIQTATMGQNWTDIFNATNVIIEATTTIDPYNQEMGRANIRDVASTQNQEKKVIDVYNWKRIFNDQVRGVIAGATLGTAVSGLMNLGGTSSPHGGTQQAYMIDGQKIPRANARQMDKEALYKALMMAAPQVVMRVPIQTGFNVTVGKGFTAKLLPPAGNNPAPSYSAMTSGDYLAVNIEHVCHFDDTAMAATTVLHGLKGGVTLQ